MWQLPNSPTNQRCRILWKQGAIIFILLSHNVFGSPAAQPQAQLPVIAEGFDTQSQLNSNSFSLDDNEAELEKEVFGPDLQKRGSRKKRFFYETLKKAKQAKLLSLGEATANAAKSVGKSLVKNLATLGIKAVIFNFLYKKIHQVLDFKNRMVNNLEQKNKDQNSQVLGNSDGDTTSGDAASSDTASSFSSPTATNSSTEAPDDIPMFDRDKISLQVPEAVFGPAFNVANGASQVIGNLIQNTALRIARLFDSLKPLLRISVGVKSRKRQTGDAELDSFESASSSTAESEAESAADDNPIKSSFEALSKNK